MTTDIKSRLSGLGKQWKEKRKPDQSAEEASGASPAENVAAEQESGSAAPDRIAAAAEEAADIEAAEAGKVKEPLPERPEPDAEEAEGRRLTDEELARILRAFGWTIPAGAGGGSQPFLPGATLSAPAIEELAAEVTSAMEGFEADALNVYEEESPAAKAEEELRPTQTVPQTTAVFPAVGGRKEAAEPEIQRPEKEEAPPLETEIREEAPIDAKELFSGMNQEILKEVFTEEELHTLEGDATHVFKKEELENLSEKQKEEEQKKRRREAPDRRRTKRAVPKAETKPKEKAPARRQTAKAEAEPVYTARDYRPIRRKRSYRTGLRGGLMYFGFVVCVSIILASVGWLAADDVLSLNKEYVEAEVYVGESVDMKQVSDELYNKGLIKYRQLFRIFAKLMKAETKIEPGVYKLSTKLDYNAMVHAMHQREDTPTERATVMVLIPEGKTLKQTFQILAEHGVCPYETLLECAANYEFKYDFLEDLPYGEETRLEGYLFPDTYEFYASSKPEEAIGKFLSNFNAKVTAEMRQQAADMGYTLQEMLTIASLVEMEAGKDTERATIASVIYNRLNSSYYPYLQIDATIQYALEERKESLTNQDLEIDSPYNTYKYTGLPPGPIANPGLASIRAALEPESTGYYFYALNKNGSHNFFATMDQFNSFVNSSEFGG